jgi:tubulin polyglutamylase TTLL7
MCFELLGFDVIIGEDFQPTLLEINYTPSFSTDTPLDWNIKSSLIHDTIELMGLTKEFKETTVRARKECRDVRMMTGKKNKLTPEEKEERRRECVRERD